MKVIESIEDNFKFDRAFVVQADGILVPRAVFGGALCDIETKSTALQHGIAYCRPVDGTPEDSWPIGVIVEKETADGDPYEETMWNFTANPRIVAAARKFDELNSTDSLKEGMAL